MRLAFENLNGILAAAGCSFADVVDATVFMVNPDADFERAWAVAADTGAARPTRR